MTNRREFLQTGVTVSALPLAMNGLLAPGTAAARRADAAVPLHRAIADGRYAEGRRFADALRGIGVPTEPLRDGDVTDTYLSLDRRWREHPAAIAGLTQFGPLLVLERLGREHGLRVALRVEHQIRADGTLAHVISGAPETLALAEALQREGHEWPVLSAALAASCRADCSAPAESTIVTPGRQPVMTASGEARATESVIHYYRAFALQEGHAIPWDGPLFSWVIAPSARARR